MVDQLSPLAPVLRAGRYGNSGARIAVTLSEPAPGSIVQVVAWPGGEHAVIDAISKIAGLAVENRPGSGTTSKSGSAFSFAPGKFLVVQEDEGLETRLAKAVPGLIGAVTDLSHGRTAIRVAGPKSEWVLAKLFAVDLSAKSFPVGAGLSTKHHEIFAQIQRTGADQFDLYVFRSFARSFWHTLTRASEEVGYQVS